MRSERTTMRRPPTSARRASSARGAPGAAASASRHVGLGAERGHEGRRGDGQPGRRRSRRGSRPPTCGSGSRRRRSPPCRRAARPRTSSGSTPSMAGSAKGVWKKCTARRSGRALGQHPAEQREVVVLHQHGAAPVGPGRPRRRPRPGCSAGSRPRPAASAGRSGAAGQVEEVVVAVPEGRVGHDVVGHPVGVVVDGHRDQVEPVLVHAPLGHRLAVGRAHRHRDPGRAGAGQDPVQGRGQPAAGRDRDQLAVGPGAEGQRAAVGDDDGGAHRRAQEGRGNVGGRDPLERGPQHVDGLGAQLVQRAVAVDALTQVDLGQAVRAE